MNKNKGLVNLDEDEKLEIAKRIVKGPPEKPKKPRMGRKTAGAGKGNRMHIDYRRSLVFDWIVRKAYSYKKIQSLLKQEGIHVSIETINKDIQALRRKLGKSYSAETLLWMAQQKCDEAFTCAYEDRIAAGPGTKEAIQADNVMATIALGVFRIMEPAKLQLVPDTRENVKALPESTIPMLDVRNVSPKDYEVYPYSHTTCPDKGQVEAV